VAESQDVDSLKRRGRRRLVGAIALVLLAVIVLPMVFDPEPRTGAPPVSVRIPGEDDSGFAPKVVPKVPATTPAAKEAVVAKPEPPKAEAPKAEPPKPEPAKAEEAKPVPKPAPAEAKTAESERARAEAALANVEFIIPVAALSNAAKVKELTAQLAAAKLPYYTEPIATKSGTVTRVRAGPFPNREAADKALQAIKRLGLKPGGVTSKS
jgi:DedD protein